MCLRSFLKPIISSQSRNQTKIDSLWGAAAFAMPVQSMWKQKPTAPLQFQSNSDEDHKKQAWWWYWLSCWHKWLWWVAGMDGGLWGLQVWNDNEELKMTFQYTCISMCPSGHLGQSGRHILGSHSQSASLVSNYLPTSSQNNILFGSCPFLCWKPFLSADCRPSRPWKKFAFVLIFMIKWRQANQKTGREEKRLKQKSKTSQQQRYHYPMVNDYGSKVLRLNGFYQWLRRKLLHTACRSTYLLKTYEKGC